MRHKEEIEFTVLDFRLFDESIVDVGSLGRVLDELVALLGLSLLEESLTNTLVYDDQGNFWFDIRLDFNFFVLLFRLFLSLSFLEETIFLIDDLVQLVEFLVDDHLSHGIADTITIDENVFWHGIVKVLVALERSLEVIRQYT